MKSQTKLKQTEIGKIPKGLKRSDDFVKALSEFLLKEKFLLASDLNERTMTHKLAEYLQKYFQDYNVDCEYNRMMTNQGYDTKQLGLDLKNVETNDIKGTTVIPDIVIHRRGDNKSNLLVIEVKKKISSGSKQLDFEKLKAFTSELKYEYGAYVEFDRNGLSDCGSDDIPKFFKDGEEVNE